MTDTLPHTDCRHCRGTGKQLDHQLLGLLLREERQAAKLSLQAVADRLGISMCYLGELERGMKPWTIERAENFRRALNQNQNV